MPAPRNRLKSALAQGHVQRGLWLALASPGVAELAAGSGFDWCLIDGEHGPNTVETILDQARALAAHDTSVVARVPFNEQWILKQVLDLGVQSIVIPMVHSGADAVRAAASCRYPPQGTRGLGAALARASDYNRVTDYVATANAQICVIVQVESARAIDEIDEIAGADGVDCVFIGPADLAADMGHTGNAGHPEVVAAIDHARDRIAAAGKASGILTFDPDAATAYADKGFTMIAVGGDTSLLGRAFSDLRAAFDD